MKKTMFFRSSFALTLACFGVACGSPPPLGSEEENGSGGGSSGLEGSGGSGGPGGPAEGVDAGASSSREEVRELCAAEAPGPRLLRRLTLTELDQVVKNIFPEIVNSADFSGVRLPADSESPLGFSTDAATLLPTQPVVNDLLKSAEAVADAIVDPNVLGSMLPCSADAADATCAGEFVSKYGRRLFRRSLTEEEKSRYVGLFETVSADSDFSTGLKWTITSLFQSPHAFYRSEVGEPNPEGGFDLTPTEIATNLAFTYTGYPPSDELIAKAEAGELTDLGAEAEALLNQDTKLTIRSFFSEWLQYQIIRGKTRDAYEGFELKPEGGDGSELSTSEYMAEETQVYTETMMLGNYTMLDFFTADWSPLNSKLASHYGYGEDEATSLAFVKVTRPEGQGLGVTALGSISASTAHQTHSSPTLRGLHFYEKFLCNEPTEPPEDIPALEEATAEAPEDATTREQFELFHATGTTCKNCHIAFEPFGFAFEEFDEAGVFRTTEKGKPIDAKTTVRFSTGEVEIDGMTELANQAFQNQDMQNCASGMLAAYFLSGAGGQSCAANSLRTQVAQGQISIRQYLLGLAQTEHFRHRE
ncbi:MAG: DUF1588 domain-containing protein [Polyangiaceae bacterium]|nr:DUF1588 domain-containing protein [Polyangiaceae bacterium]